MVPVIGTLRGRPRSAGRFSLANFVRSHIDEKKKDLRPSLCILSGEVGRHKTSAENLFSLPICDIMELTESLPPRCHLQADAVARRSRDGRSLRNFEFGVISL